ncbi:hypothetical protein [Streptomyces sp. NPDC059063]|uniref:hypothetical protein n=1 Tax=unclassified Streptomyces TaxID=2593676 RepID=UPI0036C044E8
MTSHHGNSGTAQQAVRRMHHRVQSAGDNITAWRIATVVARLALAASFLSAVSDRLGLWGEPGTNSVAWGTFDNFVTASHDLMPYLSGGTLRAAAAAATAAELGLGVALLLGVALRWTAWLTTALLLVFGLSMAVFVDPQAPLIYSVFSALAAAALLALAPRDALVYTVKAFDRA